MNTEQEYRDLCTWLVSRHIPHIDGKTMKPNKEVADKVLAALQRNNPREYVFTKEKVDRFFKLYEELYG